MLLNIFLNYYITFFSFFNLFDKQIYYYFVFFLNHFQKNLLLLNVFIENFSSTNFTFFNYNVFFKHRLTTGFVLTISPDLLVGFYNIHPSILYILLILFVNKFCSTSNEFFLPFRVFFLLTSATLLLGGIWGASNSVWGYFWVNDIIEQLLLFLCLFCLFQFHVFLWFKQDNFFLTTVILWGFLLIFVRWGFVFSRHSFFDAATTINSSILYFLIYIPRQVFFITCFIVNLYKFFFIFIYFFYFIRNWVLYHLNYFVLLFAHLFFFVCALVWLKHTANNLFIFPTYTKNFIKIFLFKLNTWTNFHFLQLNKLFFNLFQLKVFTYYFWKLNLNKIFFSFYLNFLVLWVIFFIFF